MEKRTETGLVMGHAYGVTAVKKVKPYHYKCNCDTSVTLVADPGRRV